METSDVLLPLGEWTIRKRFSEVSNNVFYQLIHDACDGIITEYAIKKEGVVVCLKCGHSIPAEVLGYLSLCRNENIGS